MGQDGNGEEGSLGKSHTDTAADTTNDGSNDNDDEDDNKSQGSKASSTDSLAKESLEEESVEKDGGEEEEEEKKKTLKEKYREMVGKVQPIIQSTREFINDPVGGMKKIRKKAKKKMRKLEGKLMNYGPPYVEDYGGNLKGEVNIAAPAILDIHNLLASGANPNIPDPDDDMNTALHYAARHLHLSIMKMLCRAGGNLEQVNSLGMQPLQMLAAFNHKGREYDEREFVRFLLDEDCNINHRDKGGFTALELACLNGNMELVKFLIKNGAKSFRTTDMLYLPTSDLLEDTENVMILEMIKAQVRKEKVQYNKREMIRANELAEKKRRAKVRLAKLKKEQYLENLSKMEMQKNIQRKEALAAEERRKQIIAERKARAEEEAEKARALGHWKKNERTGLWSFVRRGSKIIPQNLLMTESTKVMEGIEAKKKDPRIGMRWTEITGHSLGEPLLTEEQEEELKKKLEEEAERMEQEKLEADPYGAEDIFDEFG